MLKVRSRRGSGGHRRRRASLTGSSTASTDDDPFNPTYSAPPRGAHSRPPMHRGPSSRDGRRTRRTCRGRRYAHGVGSRSGDAGCLFSRAEREPKARRRERRRSRHPPRRTQAVGREGIRSHKWILAGRLADDGAPLYGLIGRFVERRTPGRPEIVGAAFRAIWRLSGVIQAVRSGTAGR